MQSNIEEPKELVVDLRCRKRHPTPVFMYKEGVEMVNTYKFLRVYLNNKLEWSSNTEAL